MKKITALLIYFCFISIFSNVYALSLGPEQRGFSLKSSNIDRLVALQEKYERLQELLVPEEFNFDEVIQLAQEINIFQIKFDIFFIFSEEKMNYQFFIEDGKAIYDLIGPIFLEKIKAYEEEAVVESDSEEELEYSKICGDLKKEEDDLEKLKIDLRNVQNKISNLEKKLGDFQKDLSRAEKGQRKIIRSKIVLVKKSLGETKRRKELLVQRRDKLEKSIKQKRINKKEQEQKIVLLELRKKEAVSQKQIPEYLKSWKKIFTAIEGFKQTKQSKQTKIKNLLRLLDTIEQKDKNNYKLICVYVYEFLVCYIRQEIEELVKDISLDEQCYLSNENKKIIKYFICCILVIRKKSEYLNIKTLNLLSITTVFSIRTFYACRVKIEIKDQIAFYDEMFKELDEIKEIANDLCEELDEKIKQVKLILLCSRFKFIKESLTKVRTSKIDREKTKVLIEIFSFFKEFEKIKKQVEQDFESLGEKYEFFKREFYITKIALFEELGLHTTGETAIRNIKLALKILSEYEEDTKETYVENRYSLYLRLFIVQSKYVRELYLKNPKKAIKYCKENIDVLYPFLVKYKNEYLDIKVLTKDLIVVTKDLIVSYFALGMSLLIIQEDPDEDPEKYFKLAIEIGERTKEAGDLLEGLKLERAIMLQQIKEVIGDANKDKRGTGVEDKQKVIISEQVEAFRKFIQESLKRISGEEVIITLDGKIIAILPKSNVLKEVIDNADGILSHSKDFILKFKFVSETEKDTLLYSKEKTVFGSEFVDIIDMKGKVVGLALEGFAHSCGLRHKKAVVFILTPAGKLVLCKELTGEDISIVETHPALGEKFINGICRKIRKQLKYPEDLKMQGGVFQIGTPLQFKIFDISLEPRKTLDIEYCAVYVYRLSNTEFEYVTLLSYLERNVYFVDFQNVLETFESGLKLMEDKTQKVNLIKYKEGLLQSLLRDRDVMSIISLLRTKGVFPNNRTYKVSAFMFMELDENMKTVLKSAA